MHVNSIQRARLNRMAVWVLLTCCFITLPANAQLRERTKVGSPGLVGFGRGDVLRFTAFNPQPTDGRGEAIRMKMRLYDAHGEVIAESAEVVIPPDEFRSVEFKRDELPVAGEPDTGLLQVRTTPLWRFRSGYQTSVTTSLELTNGTMPGGTYRFYIVVEALP